MEGLAMNKNEINLLRRAEESDRHVEIIDGAAVERGMTTPEHYAAVEAIADSIKAFIQVHNGGCVVFRESIGLQVSELCDNTADFFMPDVMVVCDPAKIDEKGVHVAPRFVAEVTSPSTRRNDYNSKLDTYKKIGVDEYWIVDLQKKVVFQYLKSDDYIPQFFIHPESLGVSVFPGLNICLECMRTPKK